MEKCEQLTLEDVGILLPPEEKKVENSTECSEGHGPFAESTNETGREGETKRENNCDCASCKHDVELRSLKRDYVTYCKTCGKILTVYRKNKKR